MTDVSTHHPYGIPYIELTEKGRKISFQRDCFGEISIFRKVEDEKPKLLIDQVRTPFIDSEKFPKGTKLSYSIVLGQNQESKQYELEVML